MKKYYHSILFVLCLLVTGLTYSQELKENQIPQAVKDSFAAKYSNTYVYEWEWKKKEKLYEAEFMLKGNKYEAYFMPDGQWIRTERDIKKRELPKAIKDAIAQSEYADWEIDDVEEHSTPKYEVVYEVEVEKGKQETYLYFLPDGSLVETIIKK